MMILSRVTMVVHSSYQIKYVKELQNVKHVFEKLSDFHPNLETNFKKKESYEKR